MKRVDILTTEWPPAWVGWHKPTRQACEEASTETMKRVMRPACSCGADDQQDGRFTYLHEFDCKKFAKEIKTDETADVHRGRRIIDSSVRGGGTDQAKPDPTEGHGDHCSCIFCGR